jgi:putative thioredoxin
VTDVVEASRQQPVIVDFWAPWCGPCKQLGPALEKVVREAGGKVKLVKINVDENQQLAAQMRVQSIPAVFAFVDGQPVDGFMGALPESQLKQFIGRLSGKGGMAEEIEAALTAARQALAQKEYQAAAQIFAQVAQADREHAGALAGLARCQIAAGDLDNAKATLALVPPAKANDPDVLGAKAALVLALNPVDRSALADLKRQVEKDPDDFRPPDLPWRERRRAETEAADQLYVIPESRLDDEAAVKLVVLRSLGPWG